MSVKPSIHWLFVFLPVTVILEHASKVPPPVIFFSAALKRRISRRRIFPCGQRNVCYSNEHLCAELLGTTHKRIS